MNYIQSFLLAFSLSLDCFAISISQGLKPNKSKQSLILLAFLFGLFQAGMFIGGYFAGTFVLSFFSKFANWIAAALLAFIGIKMIKEGFEEDEETANISSLKEYLVLSVATSIDALAAGVSFTTIKANFPLTSLVVGLISFIMAIIGGFAGKEIGKRFGKYAEAFGGLVLIGLAIKTLF